MKYCNGKKDVCNREDCYIGGHLCKHYDGTGCVEIQTNADHIRSMSDEELADFLSYTWATSARAWQKDPGETLYWLQQQAEDGNNDR